MPVARLTKKKVIKPGPVYSKERIPYDYIVIIDSGSKGSRVYVYNWLNPEHALAAGYDVAASPELKFDSGHDHQTDDDSSDDTDEEVSEDSGKDKKSNGPEKRKKQSGKGKTKPRSAMPVNFPSVMIGKGWHKKIIPGLSSFNQSPQKVGRHHLNYLLSLASAVVPKSEHRRTPIFLHATAGMRILPPNEQTPILENVCTYLTSNTDFFIPDCESHVNIIDGDIEGLYGWLSINYLMRAFDNPQDHQHGKDHSTYGLLDMGGASTQVVFQPNSTESKEHQNNLYKISLSLLPQLANGTADQLKVVGNYLIPESKHFDVFSDSFLGFGMFQARSKYRKMLADGYREHHGLPEGSYSFRTPVSDPCLPKGFTTKEDIMGKNVDFIGESDFPKCLTSIFPVLANATHSGGTEQSVNCEKLGESNKVSSCLLSDLIPSFDFDINHFVGVSGYWDAINALTEYQKSPRDDDETEKYDYQQIFDKTSKWCSLSLSQILELNNLREKDERIHEDELAELCFKSSWILNFLHVGLGFPRFGIDEIPNKDDKFKSLQMVEKVGGSSFSWTLGRAILYANDEYAQAFNNYTLKIRGNKDDALKRPGYYFSAAEDSYYTGAEITQTQARPQFVPPVAGTKYPHFDYEIPYDRDANVLKWYIQPHRWYGDIIFLTLIGVILVLMLGKTGRSRIIERVKKGSMVVSDKVLRTLGLKRSAIYTTLPFEDSTTGFELNSLSRPKPTESDEEQFTIDTDEEV